MNTRALLDLSTVQQFKQANMQAILDALQGAMKSPYAAPALGAGVGALGGALIGGKKRRLSGALSGAVLGGLGGLGYNAYQQSKEPQPTPPATEYLRKVEAARGRPALYGATESHGGGKTTMQRGFESVFGNNDEYKVKRDAIARGQDPAAAVAAWKRRTKTGNEKKIPASVKAWGGASNDPTFVTPAPKREEANPALGYAAYGVGGTGLGALLGAALSKQKNRKRNAALGAALGGSAGLLANYLLSKQSAEMTKEANMQAIIDKLMPYLTKAREAGGAFLNSPAGQHALGGGAIGAGLGGLYGLMAPGEDEYGERRNRLGSMLRGALGGGALGAGAGGLLGHFAPNAVSQLTAQMRDAARSRPANQIRKTLGLPVPQADPTTVSGTARGSLGGASMPAVQTSAGLSNVLGKPLPVTTRSDKLRADATYTPTAPDAGNRRAAIDLADQAAGDVIDGTAARAALSGYPNPHIMQQHRSPARRQQDAMDEATGVTNASPALLKLRQQDPAAFARILEEAREQAVNANVQSAPSRGFDMTNIDTSNMQLPPSTSAGSLMRN